MGQLLSFLETSPSHNQCQAGLITPESACYSSGKICDVSPSGNFCTSCTNDDQCTSAYGTGILCTNGQCMAAPSCPSCSTNSDCAKSICKGTPYCAKGRCNPCQGGLITPESNCYRLGKICDTSSPLGNFCTSCTNDDQCTSAYGTGIRCANGRCTNPLLTLLSPSSNSSKTFRILIIILIIFLLLLLIGVGIFFLKKK